MWGWLIVLCTILVLAIAFGAGRLLRRPSLHKAWKPELQHIVTSEQHGETVIVHNVRSSHYQPDGEATIDWQTRRYDLRKLKRVWLLIEPFHPTIKGIAHTFLSFEFEDNHLAVSVEARSQIGQKYSIVQGFFGVFELIYVYGDERDLILRRTNLMQHDVYMYPLITPPNEVRMLFTQMLTRANRLSSRPCFYHSVVENCTSVLRNHANRVRPGSFPRLLLAQVLPGISDRLLYTKGWIDTTLPFESLRNHANIAPLARRIGDVPDFSTRIRAYLQTSLKPQRDTTLLGLESAPITSPEASHGHQPVT